jgi:hypothetical protein
MRAPLLSQSSLFVVSTLILALALTLWVRRESPLHRSGLSFAAVGAPSGSGAQLGSQSPQQTQQTAALLFRAFQADNYLTYNALSRTEVMFGNRSIVADARVTHTPQSLAISYISGPHEGLHCGFNQPWFWRQENAAPMQAYAEVQHSPSEMATKRFALMLQNYMAERRGSATIDKRPVQIVDLRPFRPVPGASGPAKRLWIDEQTGLTLRLETFNYEMKPVMRTTLIGVDEHPKIDGAAMTSPAQIRQAAQQRPCVAQEEGNDRREAARRTGLWPPEPKYLPVGFQFDGVGMHHCQFSGSAYCAALSRYTDGLNTLTVFVVKHPAKDGAAAPGPAGAKPEKDSQSGPKTCDFGPGTVALRSIGFGQLVAVADLPASELQHVLDSIAPEKLRVAPGTFPPDVQSNSSTVVPSHHTPGVVPVSAAIH